MAEMLKHIDIDILHLIADAFRLRLLNHKSEDQEKVWDEIFINLIPKMRHPKTIRDFRPIAILPVLLKLYCKLLDYLVGDALCKTSSYQFAFKSGHQCHEVIFILRRLVEISLEWATPIWILDGDIVKAYDNTQHDKIYNALRNRGVLDILVAAIMREVARPGARLRMGGFQGTRVLNRSRALWQGDPLAPKLFNVTLDVIAKQFDKEASRRRWGWPLKVFGKTIYMCLTCFADH